jgi:hypothetical protein
MAARETGLMKDAGTFGTFGGAKSKTADLTKLKVAQAFEAAGAPPEQIWTQTGWMKGPDGHWRYEIPDNAMTFNPEVMKDLKRGPSEYALADAVNHPELFKAYPELENYKFATSSNFPHGTAEFAPDMKQITMSPSNINPNGTYFDRTGAKVVPHEIEHAVQTIEGRSLGSSPEAHMSPDVQLDNYTEHYGKAYDKYRRTLGETEARNTEARLKMTPEQRRASFPQWTQDVKPEDIIIQKLAEGGLVHRSKQFVKDVNPIKKQHYRQTMHTGALTKMRTRTKDLFK